MDEVKTEGLQTQRFKPLLWVRFIDDLFLYGLIVKKIFTTLKDSNNFKSTLEFTFECNGISINCLDLNVKLNSNELATSVYIKPMDCQQYLHYMSFHPCHIKQPIACSGALRAGTVNFGEGILGPSICHGSALRCCVPAYNNSRGI